MQGSQQFLRVDQRLVIQMLQKNILHLADTFRFLRQQFLIEQFTYLEADLCVFIGVERGDAGLGGPKGPASQPFLLILVK